MGHISIFCSIQYIFFMCKNCVSAVSLPYPYHMWASLPSSSPSWFFSPCSQIPSLIKDKDEYPCFGGGVRESGNDIFTSPKLQDDCSTEECDLRPSHGTWAVEPVTVAQLSTLFAAKKKSWIFPQGLGLIPFSCLLSWDTFKRNLIPLRVENMVSKSALPSKENLLACN